MKKYIILSTTIIFIGVIIAIVWVSGQASPYPKPVLPQELASWIVNVEDAIIETHSDYLYIQEAIGSTAVELKNPQLLENNFKLQFQLLSLTQAATLHFSLQKENDIYDIEISFSNQDNKIKLSKNKLFLLEKEVVSIRPNAYYGITIEHQLDNLNFFVNENRVLSMSIAPQPIQLGLSLIGHPNNPAAFEIRDMQIIPLP